MWVLKLKIKHDCVIGNRCEKFDCISYSMPLTQWEKGKFFFSAHRHTVEGKEENIKKFFSELKKDTNISEINLHKNSAIVVEKRKIKEVPTGHYNQKMFFTKPVFVDKKGCETWEVASFEKKVLIEFLGSLKKEKTIELSIEKIQRIKSNDISFPKIMPTLSSKQKEAYNLAIEKDYYSFPRKTNLKTLAKIMGVSISTFQEHLRKAEEKVMPSWNK
jgi:predicted DNA binding protein